MSNASLEGWLLYSRGEIERDVSGAGMIYGVHAGAIDNILNELIDNFGDYFDGQMQNDCELTESGCIDFKLENIHWNEGQMSFPETGQWDFAPHWEFNAKITKHEKWPDYICETHIGLSEDL